MNGFLRTKLGQAMIAAGVVTGIADQAAPTVEAAEKLGSIKAELGGESKGRATSVRIHGKTIGVDGDGVLSDTQIERGTPYYDEDGQLLFNKGGVTSRIELNKQPRAYTAKPVLPKEVVEEPAEEKAEEAIEKPKDVKQPAAPEAKKPTPAELLRKTLPKGKMTNPYITGLLQDNAGADLPKETRTWVLNPIAVEPNGRTYRGISAVPPTEWETVRHTMTFEVNFYDVDGQFETVLILPIIQPYADVNPLKMKIHVDDTGLKKEEISFVIGTTAEVQSTAFIRLHVQGTQPQAAGKISVPLKVTIDTDVAVPVSDGPATMAAVGRSREAVAMKGLRPGVDGAVGALVERGVVRSDKDAVAQGAFFPIQVGSIRPEPRDAQFVQLPFDGMQDTAGMKFVRGTKSFGPQGKKGHGTVTHTVEKVEKPDADVQRLFEESIKQRKIINAGGLALGGNLAGGQD